MTNRQLLPTVAHSASQANGHRTHGRTTEPTDGLTDSGLATRTGEKHFYFKCGFRFRVGGQSEERENICKSVDVHLKKTRKTYLIIHYVTLRIIFNFLQVI